MGGLGRLSLEGAARPRSCVTRLSRLVTSDPYGSMLCRPCLGSGRPASVEVPYPFRRLSRVDGSWDVNKTVQRVYASTRVSDLPPVGVEPVLRPYLSLV